MLRLTIIGAVIALGLGFGCKETGDAGDLCDQDEDCLSGFVCISHVANCDGEDCWGTCEKECVEASDCDGGEVCLWVQSARICRPSEYQGP